MKQAQIKSETEIECFCLLQRKVEPLVVRSKKLADDAPEEFQGNYAHTNDYKFEPLHVTQSCSLAMLHPDM